MKLAKYFLASAIALTAGTLAIDKAEAVTPAQPGTYQYDLLAPHLDWIKKVTGCCNWAEGRGEFEENVEVRFKADGTPYNHYSFVLDPEAYGVEGDPIVIDVPDRTVLSGDKIARAEKSCEDRPTESCLRPAFNVAWLVYRPNSSYNNAGDWHIYCYLPSPQMGENTPAEGPDLAQAEEAPEIPELPVLALAR